MDPVPVAQGGYGHQNSCDLNELTAHFLAEAKGGLNLGLIVAISADALGRGQRADNGH